MPYEYDIRETTRTEPVHDVEPGEMTASRSPWAAGIDMMNTASHDGWELLTVQLDTHELTDPNSGKLRNRSIVLTVWQCFVEDLDDR